jgi:outer membrane protein
MFRRGPWPQAPGRDVRVPRERQGRRFLIPVSLSILVATRAFAQTPGIPKVEFDEAIQRAIANNPTVAQAATAITRANLLVQQARAVTLPEVSARVTNATLNSEVSFNGLVAQPQNQSTFSGDVTVPVLDLSRWAAVPQARDQVKVAELSTDLTRREIAIATAEAYLTVVVSRRQLEVDQRAVDNARAHLDYAQRRLQAGGGSRLNELRAASSESTDELHLENSRLGLRRAQEALGVLIAADGPLDAGAEPSLDVPSVINEQDWRQARADVRVQEATQAAAERVVHDSWRDWVGTASASFDPQ